MQRAMFAGVLLLALFSAGAVAAAEPTVTIFLSDPDLGVTGRITTDSGTYYFALLRPHGGMPGDPLTGRITDNEGRLVAAVTPTGALPDGTGRTARVASARAFAVAADRLASDADATDDVRTTLANVLRAVARHRGPGAPTIRGQRTLPQTDAAPAALRIDVDDASSDLRATFGPIRVDTVTQRFVDVAPDGTTQERVEISTRYLTDDGRTILLSLGGDHTPAGWEDAPADVIDPDAHLRTLAYIAATGRKLLRETNAPAATQAAAALAETVEANLVPVDAAEHVPSDPFDTEALVRPFGIRGRIGTTATTPAVQYQQIVTIYGGYIVPPTTHSAVRVSTYKMDNVRRMCVFLGNVDYNNHGRSPSDSSMKAKCLHTTAWRATYSGSIQKCASPYSALSSCKSEHANKGCGSSTASHNCHDDTVAQYRTVKAGTQYGTCSGVCADCSTTATTPPCS
jgi:hypothetical protein